MGGNDGIRGYLLQTIICVLDALEEDNNWTSVTLEPLDASEKVDIKWIYEDNYSKVCQVKSSRNILRLSAAKEWSTSLESTHPGANSYELILLGNMEEKLQNSPKIGNVHVAEPRPLNIQILIDQASTKIDHYYERIGKPKISAKVREILVQTLTAQFATNSIVGREVLREEFNEQLKGWITSIENQIETNPFVSLAPIATQQNVELDHRVTSKVLDLIGWSQLDENISLENVDEETGEIYSSKLNFQTDFDDKLKENIRDYVFIKSRYDITYPSASKEAIERFLRDTHLAFEQFKRNRPSIRVDDKSDFHSLFFWITTSNAEIVSDYVYTAKENFKRNLLEDQFTYHLIDNARASFLVSSIVTAKNYRSEVPVKFLYPITEANQNPGSIGLRGLRLPVQFINSSVLPIIKEDKNTISFLLFSSDAYSSEALKKLIWLTIKLSSGFGNEYLLYFADYDELIHRNDAAAVIRSFNDENLEGKVKIQKFARVDAQALDSLNSLKIQGEKNHSYEGTESTDLQVTKHLNETFINILPYGDVLRPFLITEAISANDLKIFLAKKGIFVKNAEKSKLVNLMCSLLFSPAELEDFKALIDVKQRNEHTTNEYYNIKVDRPLQEVFQAIRPNFDNVGEGFRTQLLNQNLKVEFNPQNPNEFRVFSATENKNPTSQVSVNTEWGNIDVTFRKESSKVAVSQISSISREDKLIANRIVKVVVDELKRVDFVKEETIKVMFSDFKNNADRINFLLSFTNTTDSALLSEADIKSIRFKFDENTDIPEKYKDKADKDLIINFDGKTLGTLHELVDPLSKESVFLEEMKIVYKFNHQNIGGAYKVTYNFSNALKGKNETNGTFKSEPFLFMSSQIKRISNIEGLKKTLSKEIERLKISKLKEFNIIE